MSGESDFTHQLEIWMALPTPREQRRYLENHLDLLDTRSETLLQGLRGQGSENLQQEQKIGTTLQLLRDVRKRGGTAEAVREAYINLHGGFVLDLPSWLEEVEQRLTDLLNQNRQEETAELRMVLLQDTLAQIQKETSFPPELLATLRRELGDVWQRHPRTDRALAFETAIKIYEEVLLCYDLIRYPYQYAKTQNNLGLIYEQRIRGEGKENLERALTCYQEALRVWTLKTFPSDYARVQTNLGVAYRNRITGQRTENLERALTCYQEALHVRTLDTFPIHYAMLQSNLGIIYWERLAGQRKENLEQALAHYQEALQVLTLDTFPFHYAAVQNNIGEAYQDRLDGERSENLEHAILCHQEALRFWTLDAFPFHYAGVQINLGSVYEKRVVGERRENTEQSLAHYQKALQIYTLEAFPRESRNVHLSVAETRATLDNWDTVRDAYQRALEAEDLLVILGSGTLGRDAILKEGRNASIRLGYAFHRLEYITEAAIAMERGRARGLVEAMTLNAADPALITNEERRTRYTYMREKLISAQADLHALSLQDFDEATRRRLDLERTATYRQARAAFDTIIAEIRTAEDPADFLNAPLDAATILRAAERIGPGHALVYLAATPWGGVAIAAANASSSETSISHFAALDLPGLTEAWVNGLVKTCLQDGSERLIGGFAQAQAGEGFEQLCQQWEGETLQACVKALCTACHKTKQTSTLALAAQQALRSRQFARLAKRPLASLTQRDRGLLSGTFDHFFLRNELDRCLEQLGITLMHPLMGWLHESGVSSLTLIPCGHLAAFPLAAVVLPDGRSVGETLPTSIAPSARALLQTAIARSSQAGIYALGDPHDDLPWSEAEALALSALARQASLPNKAHVKRQATRERLLSALGTYWMVDACCHGTFNQKDFLRSALHLAQEARLSMAELLSHQADMRGLRLLLLSACQTALLDLEGARDEVHSLAAAMLQAGAQAVLATQWPVDDQASYLLIVRFVQEWLPCREQEPPAIALARAQAWLRSVTNADLATWQNTVPMPSNRRWLRRTASSHQSGQTPIHPLQNGRWRHIPVRGRQTRFVEQEAQLAIRLDAQKNDPMALPYADPYYWAGFQLIGW